MIKKPLARLGALVRERRGAGKLRETAAVIGIGPATLLRVESGRIPDVVTFGKLCQWLDVGPGAFLGFVEKDQTSPQPTALVSMSAHFKTDRTPKQETIQALAQMLLLAANASIEEPRE